MAQIAVTIPDELIQEMDDTLGRRRRGEALVEALRLYLRKARRARTTTREDGQKKTPSKVAEVQATWTVTAGSGRLARIHVVLPETLLQEVDGSVGARRRSQFLAEAASLALRRRREADAFEQAAGSIEKEDHPEWATSEKVAAWVRDLRRSSREPWRHSRE
ncbi:MAG: hypothetical protein HY685_03405 [Chloroflexi bacterium]|nr:hypothetical protein [Chloroflexota bacterium]